MLEKDRGITLIALVITIIVLLILAGVSIAMLFGENGLITNAKKAKIQSEISTEEEYLNLIILDDKLTRRKLGQELDDIVFNTLENKTSIYDIDTGKVYAKGWYFLKPQDIKDYEIKNSYIINYETGEYIKFDENKHRITTNELLCIKEGLVYSADPKNMTNSDSWGDAILHNFNEGEENSGWKNGVLMFDGIDDGIEVKDNSDYSKGITLEIYLTLKGESTSNMGQILMMKRNTIYDGFFMFLGGDKTNSNEGDKLPFGEIYIDIGGVVSANGSNNRFKTDVKLEENIPTYITYTFDQTKESEKGVLYINGVKTKTTELGILERLISTQENTPIQIGSDIYETFYEDEEQEQVDNRKYPFFGEIYASRVYNRPLTEMEVKYNYDMTVNNK